MFKGLTNEELVRMAQNGDKGAREYIVVRNIPLVYTTIKKFKYIDDIQIREELIQEGSIGLVKAIDGYDEKYGFRFTTYATQSIYGCMMHYIREESSGRAFKNKRTDKNTYMKIAKAEQELEQKFLRKTSRKEISEHLGIGIIEIDRIMLDMMYTKSIFEVKYKNADREDADITIIDCVHDIDESENNLVESMTLQENIFKLDDRLEKIIQLRYFKELTQKQIANIMNTSQPHINRLEKKALKELKKMYI